MVERAAISRRSSRHASARDGVDPGAPLRFTDIDGLRLTCFAGGRRWMLWDGMP
ncbi:hypothetical protein WKI65_27270 [Streptomyces sp. MS1.AVA.3]|uniref:hypothetical protein n=1 Tax=Streptomyces decoyicus TaxID=249567 RepID=UPI0030BAECF6